jgi:hypothetical protein
VRGISAQWFLQGLLLIALLATPCPTSLASNFRVMPE